MEATRIFIADSQRLFADALASALDRLCDFSVIGQASTSCAVCEIALETKPEILMIEVAAPGLNAFDVMKRIGVESSPIKFLVLSGPQHCELLIRAIRNGARGYCLKVSPLERIIDAIKKVSSGERYFDEALFTHLGESDASPTKSGAVAALTLRQRDVLKQIAQGFSAKEIGERLEISPKTVESHRFKIMQRLGIRKVAGLVHFSVREGLIEP